MFAKYLALAAMPCLLVHAAPAPQAETSLPAFTETYITTIFGTLSCSTLLGSGSKGPTPIPTTYDRPQITSVITESPKTVPSTSTVTATPIPTTATVFVADNERATITTGTSTSFSTTYATPVLGTGTETVLSCSNGAAPVSTVTEYTGTYTPVSGQITTSMTEYPTLISCYYPTSTFTTIAATTVSGSTVTTVTYNTIVATVTVSNTFTYTTTVPAATVSAVTTITQPSAASTTITTTEDCPATTTITQAARCAPTNLISNINNLGLIDYGNNPGAGISYLGSKSSPLGSDPSACCQACQDEAGCAGMQWYNYGSCQLYFEDSTHGQCTSPFNYKTLSIYQPGQGNIIAAGCADPTFEGAA